jgi:hypothetical protein
MVLAITTCSQILKNVVFKEKKPFKNKAWSIDKNKKNFKVCLKKPLGHTSKGVA